MSRKSWAAFWDSNFERVLLISFDRFWGFHLSQSMGMLAIFEFKAYSDVTLMPQVDGAKF